MEFHLLNTQQAEVFEKVCRILSPFVVEFLGTFFLTLSIGFNLINTARKDLFAMQAALGIGGTLMASVYAGGHISGAHYNPSVTLAVWLSRRNKITTLDAALYVMVQLCGSFFAALFQWGILHETFRITPAAEVNAGEAMVVEWFWTFLLCTVVLQTATTAPQAGNSFYGLAIGFTVLSGIVSVGYVSGGAFNPAILMGLNIVDALDKGLLNRLEFTWIYLVGGFLGGATAGILFWFTNRSEYSGEDHGSLFSADATAIADIAASKRDKGNVTYPGGYEDVDESDELDRLGGGSGGGGRGYGSTGKD